MKASIGTLLRTAYERARAPLAYFLVFAALGIKYFDSKYSSEAIFPWSMRFYVYRSLPNWYGLLLGDDLLFRGTTFWEDNRLRAGANMIEQHKASDVVRSKQIVRPSVTPLVAEEPRDYSFRFRYADFIEGAPGRRGKKAVKSPRSRRKGHTR
jgi:hypothetical protein